jgi:putative oxidoreductase
VLARLLATDADWVLTVARVVLGIAFFAHGAQKLLGWFGGHGLSATLRTFRDQLGIPTPLAYLAIAAEFFGGLGLIVGLLSRIAALGIAITMAVAMFKVHWEHGFFMNWFGDKQGHGIEYHLLAIAFALVLIVHGAGVFSLDQALYLCLGSPDSVALGFNINHSFFWRHPNPVKRLCFDEEFSCRRFHGVGNCHRL